MFLVKREHFSKIFIIKGLITAIFFSSFIYLAYFEIENKLLNTIFGLISLYLLLSIDKKSFVYSGFFIGILWFYWIGNSFEYYNLAYLKIPVILFFGMIYALVFYFISFIDEIYFRAFILLILSFIHPFGFNWFIPELIFINSFFPTDKIYFLIILISILAFIKLDLKFKFLALIPFLFIFETKTISIDNPQLNISMPQLNVKQNEKWVKSNRTTIVENNLKLINKAIEDKKDLIILPETAFPIYLNKSKNLLKILLEKSMKINILTGALLYENDNFFNATYYFSKGKIQTAKKVVLVPFGEKIPLPKFLVDFINNTFYNGASDYVEAKKPTDFEINGIKFRNAICYEATTDKIFETLNGVKYMIAISNNAWFTPSIEPTLQKLLLKYYARKYNITIFHSVNGSENYIVRPWLIKKEGKSLLFYFNTYFIPASNFTWVPS